MLFRQSFYMHVLQHIILIGIAHQKGISPAQQGCVQFPYDPGKKFSGNVRNNHAYAVAAVGPETNGIDVGSKAAFLNGLPYTLFRFLGISTVPVNDP